MTAQAFLFPGQGAQAVGMGRDLAEAHPDAQTVFRRAGEVLGFDLAKVCFEGPETELTKSDRAQPAIFVVSLLMAGALHRVRPELAWSAAAGLSSGEWTALHMAGALSFEDTLRVLQARGRFMQEACEQNPGGMISVIGLDRAKLDEVCANSGAEVANLNSPEQTVLSGSREAVAEAQRLAEAAGARKVIPLNVAGAFHSSLMKPAADRLADLLQPMTFRPTSMPVVSNVTARPHGGPDEIREAMVLQVTGSVRWYEGVQWMQQHGVSRYVECGPGRVLSGLVKRIDKQADLHNICDLASLKATAGKL